MDISYYKKYEPIFGSWHIVRELGEGSFGKVFEIEREDFGRKYKAALKAITIPQSKSEVKSFLADGYDEGSVTDYYRSFVEEMVEEFGIMSQLKGHPNIVGYEDHLVIKHGDGLGWDILIRMELLTPFVDHSREHNMSTADTLQLGIDICRALEACRENEIIHRDIKPENIFASRYGGYKLGDFGIARTVEKTTGGLSKKGTYSYMAPEVYKGEAYGASVDIYSLGVVLYRLLNNNCLPFVERGKTGMSYSAREEALMRRMRGEPLPAPANADAQLASVILKACAYDPKERYASPTEMREALEAVKNVPFDAPKAAPVAETEDPERTTGIFYTREPVTTPEEKTTCIFTEKPTEEAVCPPAEEEDTDKTLDLYASQDEAPTVIDTGEAEKIPVQLPKEHRQPLAETPKVTAPAAKPKKKKRIVLAALAVLLIAGGVLGIALSGGKTDVVDTGNDPTAEQTPTPAPTAKPTAEPEDIEESDAPQKPESTSKMSDSEYKALKAEYESTKATYEDGIAQLEAAKKMLEEGKRQLEANRVAYEQGKETLSKLEQLMPYANSLAAMRNQNVPRDTIQDYYESSVKPLARDLGLSVPSQAADFPSYFQSMIADGKAQIKQFEDGQAQIAQGEQQIADGERQFAEMKKQLDEMKKRLDEAKA